MTVPAHDTLEGSKFDWVLTRPLPGQSGKHAELWLAKATIGNAAPAVIKIASSGPGREGEASRRQTQRELTRLEAMSDSQYIVKPIDTPKHPAEVWYAMQYARDGSLEQLWSSIPRRPLRSILRIAGSVVQGLDEAQTVHRDLQPENLLVFRDGDGLSVRITDWGRSVDHGVNWRSDHLRPTSAAFGAPQAFDREQPVDVRDDLFSLAAVMWWCITGVAPGLSAADALRIGPDERVDDVLATIAHRRAHLRRLDDQYPGLPSRVAELVGTLLSVPREARVPQLDSRHELVQWVIDQLAACEQELDEAEKRRGTDFEVGPGVVPAPAALEPSTARRALSPPRVERPPATGNGAVERLVTPTAATATPTLVRPREPMVKRTPWLREEERTLPLAPPHPRAELGQPRLTRALNRPRRLLALGTAVMNAALLVTAFVELGVMTPVAVVAGLAVALAVLRLDLVIAARPPRRARTLSRVAVGVAIVAVGVVGLAHALFANELSIRTPSTEHAELTAAVVAADRRNELEVARLAASRERAQLEREALGGTGRCDEECKAVRRAMDDRIADLTASAQSQARAYQATKDRLLERLDRTPSTTVEERSLPSYIASEPAALLLCTLLVLLLLALELTALLPAGRVLAQR